MILKYALTGREGNVITHAESPSTKNPFLQDLDRLDVSIHSLEETCSNCNQLLPQTYLTHTVLCHIHCFQKGEFLTEPDFDTSSLPKSLGKA